jgi:hypothetical protein
MEFRILGPLEVVRGDESLALGTRVVTLDDNGRGSLWDIQPQSWARRACEVAGRSLTRAEWNDALPERTYAPACTQP